MGEKMDKELEKKVEEIVEKKTKSKNNVIVIFVMLLVFVSVLFAGYVLMDKGIILSDKKNDEVENNEVTKEELDINSTVVQELYNMVSEENSVMDSALFWRYSADYFSESTLNDFYSDKGSEIIKMQLVAKNLNSNNGGTYFQCDDSIPDDGNIGKSFCWYEREYNEYSWGNVYYEREYIERIYKKIFGSDAKLDTSVEIKMNVYGITAYRYVAKHDKYFLYRAQGGGTGGPGGYLAKLSSAVKEGNKIIITENVTNDIYENDVKAKTEKFKFVYTFEQEKDGSYKFVSRVKKTN